MESSLTRKGRAPSSRALGEMVFFVCEGCNETLKKNKVDAHAARCRNCWAVSCVDCSVVFEGNDYAAHTSCISEAQKYEGSLYKAKAKKMSPQERWMDVVATAKLPGDSKLQNVLDRVAGYDNVPRKKAKYTNFMKNSIGMHDQATIEKVWNVFEEAYKKSEEEANAAAAEAKKEENGATNGADKKRSKPEDEEPAAEESTKKAKKETKGLKWSKLIKSALKKAPSKEIEMKALREEVLKHIRDNELSAEDDKELKKEFKEALKAESDKFAVVEVVRLTE